MLDQEIYKSVSLLIYNEAPSIESDIHILVYKKKGMIDQMLWCGNSLTADNTFRMSQEGSESLVNYVEQLHEYYINNNLGDWNVMHFVLMASGKQFNIDFDYCEDLDNGKLPYWMYVRKFKK